MKVKKGWSTEERHILKKHYNVLSMAELLDLLPGRTIKAVYAQVYYLRKRKWSFN